MNARQLSRLFTPRITVLREPELKAIGARIRHERERLGFSHDEVSLAFAPTMLHMHVVETGERPPSTNLLYWLALAGADVSFILSGNPASETASTDLGRFFDELPIADAPDATARLAAVQEKAIKEIRNFLDQQPAPLPILVADGPIGDFLRAMGELPRRGPDFLEIDDTKARELALRHICCMPLTAVAWLQLAVMARLLMHPNPAPDQ